MRTPASLFALAALAHGLLLAAPPALRHDGAFWVETTTGSEAVGEGDQIKITCLGNVTVRGSDHPEVAYTMIRRVRARDEAHAREQLEDAGVVLARQGRFLRLAVDDSAGPVELQVAVPRGLRAVLVGVESGNVEATDLDGNVQAQTSAGDVRFHHVKGSVDVKTSGGTLHLGDIGGWVRASTAGGDISADSVSGEARLETGGGDISVDSAGTSIRAETAGGKVRIGRASGAVIAITGGGIIDIGKVVGAVTAHNAGGGPINVASAGGGARCDSASGPIRVSNLSGSFRIATASGSVVAQFEGGRLLADSSVSTGSGDITVYLPSNLGVNVQARNDGASRAQGIVSEFSDLPVRLEGGMAVARGPLHGGGPVLRLEAASGTIWIKKR